MTARCGFDARFFERSCLEVAPELLGALLVHGRAAGERLVARIVELEAYLGDGSDPASHAHRGPTPRNRSMFGPGGHLYVYRSMGLHHCMNVVCGPAGQGYAVLLRAAAPLSGLEAMRAARGVDRERELCNGPGKLCQAFGVSLEHDGVSLLCGPLRLERAAPPAERILAGPRIGISRATELPYRFFLEGEPHVTRSPLNRLARPLREGARAPLRADAPASASRAPESSHIVPGLSACVSGSLGRRAGSAARRGPAERSPKK